MLAGQWLQAKVEQFLLFAYLFAYGSPGCRKKNKDYDHASKWSLVLVGSFFFSLSFSPSNHIQGDKLFLPHGGKCTFIHMARGGDKNVSSSKVRVRGC